MPTTLTAAHLLHETLLTCAPETPLRTAAARMREAGCGSILIVQEGAALGIWTEHDVLAIDFADPRALTVAVADVMSRPVRTTGRDTTLGEVGRRFASEGLRHLVVTDRQGKPAGIISQTDIVLNYGLERYLKMTRVADATTQPLVLLDADRPLAEAVREMHARGVEAAVVRAADGRQGIVTERDLTRVLAGAAVPDEIGDAASWPLLTVGRDEPLLRARDLSVARGLRHLGVVDDDGEVIALLSFAGILQVLEHEQVSHLEQALREREEALRDSERSLRLAQQVIEASQDGILITDTDGVIESVNPAFTLVTGYSAAEAVGKTPAMLQSGHHDDDFYVTLWRTLHDEGFWQGEIWNRRKNGEVYPEWLTITSLVDPAGGARKFAGVFSDITERKNTEQQVRALAYYDPLTELPNRRLFQDRLSVSLSQVRRHGQMLAVMFIDLDLFKRINDTLGHSVGDRVLKEMAERLRECVRDGDTVSRMGGDEFTVIQPAISSADDALRLARRVVDGIGRPIDIDGHLLTVTSSIGIAVFPGDGDTPEALISNADAAMYRAKDLGRNSYQLYNESMNAETFEHLAMESHLRQALERDELFLNYQVKVDLISNCTIGVEALLRWEHPAFGLLSPTQFIPLAETSGSIVPIGAWVLETACRQGLLWIESGLPHIGIAVNFSSRQMLQPDLVENITATLAATGLPPERLEIELTESVLMERIEEVAPKLHRLREMGIHISIDDFGTGYSSLAYLKRLPIDTLKIDISFIRDVPGDRDDAEIVSAIIAMAHRLGIKVVAEGVEQEAQVEFLRSLSCDAIQGYLVGRPLSAGNIEHLLTGRLLPGAPG